MTVQDGLTQLVAAAGSVTGRHYEEAGKSRDCRILVEGVLKNAPSCTAKQSYWTNRPYLCVYTKNIVIIEASDKNKVKN